MNLTHKHFSRFSFPFVLCFCLVSLLAQAQNGNSPYSRLGLGQFAPEGSLYSIGLGGLGVATSSQAYLNLINPAFLTRNTLTGFEAGFMGERKIIASANAQERNSTGNLGYFAFAFPLSKRLTLGTGLNPFSTINYVDRFEQKIPQRPTFLEYAYKGSGGITQALLAAGFKVWRGLSVGGQANYNFGSINTESVSTIIDNQIANYAVAIYEQLSFSDFSFKTALAYREKIGKNTYFSVGLTHDLAANFNPSRFRSIQRRNFRGEIIFSDTIQQGVRENVTLPSKTAFGFSIDSPFRYSFGAELSSQDWSSFRGLIVQDTMQQAYRLSVGGEITPNIESINNYFARIAYRAGVQYAQLPFTLNGRQLTETSLNVGFSLPVNRGLSSINFALTAGQRGTTEGGLLKENFFRLHLGLTVNDPQWFVRRKIN